MLEAEYNRGMNCSNLILTAEKNCDKEQDSIEMFHYNTIPYFLKMQRQITDIRLQFCYDITGKHSLDQVLEYKMANYPLLRKILETLDQACVQVEDYMLSENDIVLKPELIFLENESDWIWYCYLPGNQQNICLQFQELMEYLLQHLEHKDEQAVQLAYRIYQRVAGDGAALHTVLKEMRNEKEISETQLPDLHISQEVFEKQNTVEKEITKKAEDRKNIQPKEIVKKQPAEKLKHLIRKKLYTDSYQNMEEDTVFEADEQEEKSICHPTVCLVPVIDGVQNLFVYQGMDRSRDFHCMEGKMKLGSSIEDCDICIPIPTISRVHASVEVSARGTYLEDMNSTNGTQVNGELLKYRERRMLQTGDIISFAGENYSFR